MAHDSLTREPARFDMPRRIWLTFAALCSLLPPAFGSFLRWDGPPPGFGVFPPQVPRDAQGDPIPWPGFSPIYFAAASCVALVIVAFLVCPRWFGFEPRESARRTTQRAPLPWWFWLGAVLNLFFWGMMWFSTSGAVKYMFTPLWWSFITCVDGVVYARTGGSSIYARLPKQMLALILMSIVGWYFFEWLNYFVLENWVYPNSPQIFSEKEAYFWFTLTYTCVWPAIFELYTLLRTFPRLVSRWAAGPSFSVNVPGHVLGLLFGIALGVLVGIFPYFLFFTVWLGSLLILPAVMGLLGYWTPFSPIERGNWTPLVLVALASLITGVFWEFWNHGSNAFIPGRNPNFWVYDIPYVNVIHLFSEMPLIGYVGYLPFGIQCWVWWLLAAHLFDFNPDFDPEDVGLPGEAPGLRPRRVPSEPPRRTPSVAPAS